MPMQHVTENGNVYEHGKIQLPALPTTTRRSRKSARAEFRVRPAKAHQTACGTDATADGAAQPSGDAPHLGASSCSSRCDAPMPRFSRRNRHGRRSQWKPKPSFSSTAVPVTLSNGDITFYCPNCSCKLIVTERVPKQIACRKCNAQVTVPGKVSARPCRTPNRQPHFPAGRAGIVERS